MKFKYIALLFVAAIVAVSCTKVDVEPQGERSAIRLRVETDASQNTIVVGTRVMGSDPIYSLKIFDKSNTEVASFDDYATAGEIKLLAGKYKFVVQSGGDVASAIDAPYYYGEKTVTVVAGVQNVVELSAKLANVRISAAFSEIIKDKSNFSEYDFTVREVTLAPEDVEATRSIYISATPTMFEWTVRVVNTQGKETTATQLIDKVVARSHYNFFFDVDISAGEEDGGLSLDLKVDSTLTIYEDTIEINLEKKLLPEFKANGFVVGQQKVIKDVEHRDATMELAMTVPARTKEIVMRHTCKALTAVGLPNTVKFTTLSVADRQKIEALGISWSPTIFDNGEPQISFTNLAKVAPLGEYVLYVTLTDREDQIAEATVNFAVLPDQDHFARSVDFGAKYADFYGEWCTLDKPSDLTFQYRKAEDAEWTTVAAEDIVVTSEAEKLYQVRVKGLATMTDYIFRSYTSAAVGNEIAFKTEDAPELPNLRFDEGYWEGNYWYPNAAGGNSYWCTGNEGVVASPVNQSANTMHTEDAVAGRAIYMESVRINLGISPVKFAAGNLFTGTYKTVMSNPRASVKMGRQYAGRPLKLRGWYKYKPRNVNNDNDNYAGEDWGKPDHCHIYISLEDWGGKDVSSRPGSPRVIGYGEFKTNQTVEQYTQFEITIDYKEKRPPTHVVMAATSSHKGGDFCGAEGSQFWIDEFELVWE